MLKGHQSSSSADQTAAGRSRGACVCLTSTPNPRPGRERASERAAGGRVRRGAAAAAAQAGQGLGLGAAARGVCAGGGGARRGGGSGALGRRGAPRSAGRDVSGRQCVHTAPYTLTRMHTHTQTTRPLVEPQAPRPTLHARPGRLASARSGSLQAGQAAGISGLRAGRRAEQNSAPFRRRRRVRTAQSGT